MGEEQAITEADGFLKMVVGALKAPFVDKLDEHVDNAFTQVSKCLSTWIMLEETHGRTAKNVGQAIMFARLARCSLIYESHINDMFEPKQMPKERYFPIVARAKVMAKGAVSKLQSRSSTAMRSKNKTVQGRVKGFVSDAELKAQNVLTPTQHRKNGVANQDILALYQSMFASIFQWSMEAAKDLYKASGENIKEKKIKRDSRRKIYTKKTAGKDIDVIWKWAREYQDHVTEFGVEDMERLMIKWGGPTLASLRMLDHGEEGTPRELGRTPTYKAFVEEQEGQVVGIHEAGAGPMLDELEGMMQGAEV